MINIFNPVISKVEGGASFNIHYGLNPPEDTSMLWVKTESEPTSVAVGVENLDAPQIMRGQIATMPRAASPLAGCTDGTKIYLFIANGSYIHEFDATTKECKELTAKWASAGSQSVVGYYDGKVYIFGHGGSSMQGIGVFDVAENAVSLLGSTLTYSAKSATGQMVVNIMYLFGSDTSGTYRGSITAYNVVTNEERILEITVPDDVYYSSSALVGSKIYLFGGKKGTAYTNVINVFDIEKETVDTLSVVLPNPMIMFSACAVGTNVYIFGGFLGSTRTDEILLFDSEKETITPISVTLPATTNSLVGVAIANKVYLFGGYTGSVVLDTVNLFEELAIAVTLDTAYITASLTDNLFPLISGDTVVNIGVSGVYIGNAENKPERVTAKLHNGTTWEEI